MPISDYLKPSNRAWNLYPAWGRRLFSLGGWGTSGLLFLIMVFKPYDVMSRLPLVGYYYYDAEFEAKRQEKEKDIKARAADLLLKKKRREAEAAQQQQE